jgi:N-acetyl-anhydromuramyl-L-alanine amidase AmpD
MTSINPIVVIHESMIPYKELSLRLSSNNTIGSYHTVITRNNGSIVYVNSPENSIVAAYNSSFNGFSISNSVDSFAYHICLESPNVNLSSTQHEGYTDEQYYSLAWLIKATQIPRDRITTHKEIDLSGKAIDPRSLDRDRLLKMIDLIKTKKVIDIYR